MDYSKYEQYFSAARLSRYVSATNGDVERAKQLYVANMKLSQSFYGLINLLEVILRNRINDVLIIHFNDSDWIMNQKNGFMIDNELGEDRYIKNEVEKAEKKICRNYGINNVNSNRVLSEQTFGFWSKLFDRKYYKVLRGKPISIFNSLHNGKNRAHFYGILSKIREFRNRIYHNEPICFHSTGNYFDITSAVEIKNNIVEILNYIDPEILSSIDVINDIEEQSNNICSI